MKGGTIMTQSFILVVMGISLAACEPRNTTDLVEKGGYPRSYPPLSAKSTSTPLEKPNVEEEFFEAEKLANPTQ
jgi:hypothetical protein